MNTGAHVQFSNPYANINDMNILAFKVLTAFWNGELKEEVYITQPQGFSKQVSEHLVYKLKKAFVWAQTNSKGLVRQDRFLLKEQGFCKG